MTQRNFGNIKLYQEKQQVKRRLDKILTEIQVIVRQSPRTVQLCQRFRDCLNNPENDDSGRLPVYCLDPFAHSKNKYECILTILSIAVQTYWGFCNSDGGLAFRDRLNEYLDLLGLVITDGLDKYKVMGTKYPGYSLERK